jgi:hypothetical protein
VDALRFISAWRFKRNQTSISRPLETPMSAVRQSGTPLASTGWKSFL